jgi:hypothetical protein
MALLTAGTKLTTSLQALVWQRAGLNQTDLAALQALIRDPITGHYGAASATSLGFIENGHLFLPDNKSPAGIRINAGDYIAVDGAGNPFVIPGQTFSTSWQHS